jgi:ribosomal RNA-processing protein 36
MARARPPAEDEEDEAPVEVRTAKRQRRAAPEEEQKKKQPLAERLADEEEPEAEEEEEEEEALAALRDVPFATLQRLQRDGRGLASGGAAGGGSAARVKRLKRLNKNRPLEMRSSRPVPRGLHAAPGLEALAAGARPVGRDPRFDSAEGGEDDGAFRKRYAFLFDEALPAEKRRLKGALAREKKPARREELKQRLQSAEQTLKRETALRGEDARAAERRRREKEAVAGGKRPFYLSKAAAKQEDLVARFQDLKKAGQLDKFLEKRRKKLAQKDHVHAPTARA